MFAEKLGAIYLFMREKGRRFSMLSETGVASNQLISNPQARGGHCLYCTKVGPPSTAWCGSEVASA